MLYTHDTIVYAQISCRDMGKNSRSLMNSPELAEVSRLQGIRNSLIYMIL